MDKIEIIRKVQAGKDEIEVLIVDRIDTDLFVHIDGLKQYGHLKFATIFICQQFKMESQNSKPISLFPIKDNGLPTTPRATIVRRCQLGNY